MDQIAEPCRNGLLTHRLEIAAWRPFTDNQLINCHWRTKHKRKDSDKEFVACYAHLQRIPKATGKRRVSLEIVLVGRQKETDPWAYLKSLNDSLVSCGLLVDDTARYVEFGGTVYSRGKEAMTTIILSDLE